MSRDAARAARWIFDELPPSGARRGGDPSEHAFRHDIETFVREVVQNANDQRVGFPAVRFRPIELEGRALLRFLDAFDWRGLRAHVKGAALARPRAPIGEFLRGVEQKGRMLLLQVEDRNTVGLTGDESEGDSHFRALCKDTLYSHKVSEGAGGSYGLGKSVLWSFSGMSTVLFSSVLAQDPPGRTSPRLIGRTELPSHAARGGGRERWFTGSGWFGREAEAEGGRRAESVWGDTARVLAEPLELARTDRSGTTLLIVGFRDPAADADETGDALAARIAQAARRYFWPAMMMETRRLRVSTAVDAREEAVVPDADPSLQPFIDCYRRRADAGERLEQPGDVVRRPIALELPEPRAKQPEAERGAPTEVDLIVRLADERGRDPMAGHVAMFRGPGMVVRYWQRGTLSLGMRPFHAVLVCGEARAPMQPATGDLLVERFLRAAEPPGHDDWLPTPALKQQYKRGYAQALQRLKDRVNEELRVLLAPRPALGRKGPDKLQRRFPIGGRGRDVDSESNPFHVGGLDAWFDGSCWHFRGQLEPEQKNLAWRAELRLSELGEDGEPVDDLEIAELELGESAARCELTPEGARIVADAEVTRVAFSGKSARLTPAACFELGVTVSGVVGVEG